MKRDGWGIKVRQKGCWRGMHGRGKGRPALGVWGVGGVIVSRAGGMLVAGDAGAWMGKVTRVKGRMRDKVGDDWSED